MSTTSGNSDQNSGQSGLVADQAWCVFGAFVYVYGYAFRRRSPAGT
jgi:hypothetical protein